MSDSFDPNAWPRPRSAGTQNPTDHQPGVADDDFDDLTFDDPAFQDNDPTFLDDDLDSSTYDPAGSHARPVGEGADVDLDDDFDETRTQAGGHDDYGSDDYDDDGYDAGGYDPDGQYDDDDFYGSSGGAQGANNKLRLVGAIGAGLVVILVLAFGIKALLGGKDEPQAQPAPQPPPPAATAPGPNPNPIEAIPEDVSNAVSQAFGAWGQFAVDGNLDHVRPFFVQGADQWTRFQAESPELLKNPPGGPPLQFVMQDPEGFQVPSGDWIVRGTVTSSRPNLPPQTFRWEVRVTGTPPRVLTVRSY